MATKTHLEEFAEYLHEQFKDSGMAPHVTVLKGTTDLRLDVYRRSPKWGVLMKGSMYISYAIIDNEQGRKWVVKYLKDQIDIAEELGPDAN